MKIRQAKESDFPQVARLAEELALDYPGMENDRIWIAEEKGRVVGIVALKKHSDSSELASLGVDPGFRNRGLGRRLISALTKSVTDDIYLATIIPDFFARWGFKRAGSVPAGMQKPPAWCEGCPKEKCTVMVRAGR
jgi:N-acetylglutamate synthase-like GNAT family acetyltransferase